ncbi:MAG: hypothetical protein RLZ85_651 [Verrucomicrobiota bacterium]|jgi:hypothetical protein
MAQFQEAMTRYAYACRETIKDIGLKNAALMCRDSIMLTPPMGAGGKGGLTVTGEKAGKRAIAADVRKIYVAADNRKGIAPLLILTKKLAYSTRNGNPAEFRALLDGAARTALKRGTRILQAIANDYDDERAFKKAKNYFNRSQLRSNEYGSLGYQRDLRPVHKMLLAKAGGRFKQNGKPFQPLTNWRDKILVETDEEIKEYIASRTPKVGRLKAGWYKILMGLPKPSSREGKTNFGTGGIANYIKVHAGNAGYFNFNETPSNLNLIIGNGIADMNNVSTEADVKETVIGLRYKQLHLDLARRLKKDVDDFNNNAKT